MDVRYTHVSISARDAEALASFYEDRFDMERIPAPDFDIPVAWLRCGSQQLHIFQRDIDPPQFHHFALHVSDFERVYREARAQDLFEGYFDDGSPAVYELPDGSVQTYLRDPADNRLEVNWPSVETLDADIAASVRARADMVPQSEEALRSRLYADHPEPREQ
jgi:catechol 2,3-dioxygenase-like lactoylglutathione lyase family enzyme